MSTQIEISAGLVTIRFGGQVITLPQDLLESFAKVVRASQVLASSTQEGKSPEVTREASEAPKEPKRRRSRKPVSAALAAWMSENPGWHSEASLLRAVVEHEMTDATPKRALKIALGRKRGELFVNNGKGRWRLQAESPSRAHEPYAANGARKSEA